LGQKIDNTLVDSIEAMAMASFLPQPEKLPYVRLAIRKIDLTKILLIILWEFKAIDNKKYLNLSQPLEEIGRMLGGWHGQITKQNSPDKSRGGK
jgi:hypothetical protein